MLSAAQGIGDTGRRQRQREIPGVDVLSYVVVKVEMRHQRTQQWVIHGRHQVAQQVGRENVGEAAALDKDVTLGQHIGYHHSQHGRQAHEEHQAQYHEPDGQWTQPSQFAILPAGKGCPRQPHPGKQSQECGVGQLGIGLE